MSFTGTLVLNCAGVGSRLGLGITKALMEIGGKTMLERHMENFRHVRDLRLVVGYQAEDVIAAAKALRRDILFVYNRDYQSTGAGRSFWLGARHAAAWVMQWDGDLLVHPADAARCLAQSGPFAAYSEKRTKDGVCCDIDHNGNVRAFSRLGGQFEWTGPCRLRAGDINDSDEYVYQMLERLLPLPGLPIRAMDIDTPEDYQEALKLLSSWEN